MSTVEIVSFGYLHDAPPAAHLTIDLRHHFRDPHVSPELRYMTAEAAPVRAAVLGTPGITALVDATATAVTAFASGPSAGTVTVADGCAGAGTAPRRSPSRWPSGCARKATGSRSRTGTCTAPSSSADPHHLLHVGPGIEP